MWLNKLHTMYVSKENCETIIDKSTMIIFDKTGKNIDHNNDKIFFEIFNTIASQVFSIESNNPILQHKEPVIALNIINNIVITEIVKYILIKKPGLLKNNTASKDQISDNKVSKETASNDQISDNKVSKETASNDQISDNKVSKDKISKETIKISIEKGETFFVSPIENITHINVISLHMYTQDYIITEFNNVLVIIYNNEKFKIEIRPGNYTTDTLCEALNTAVTAKIQKRVNFRVTTIDNTLSFSSEYIEISDDEDSTLNCILGIKTRYPVKLLKRNKLQLGIKFGFENEINNFEYSTPLVININELDDKAVPNLKEFVLNYNKRFTKPVDLTEVKIDFDNYNHRGYPYYLMIEITRMV